ncbi:MFS transporter [Thiomicrospira pelophila]|uniref:MFS transporter n=1 Tax=Thiomicrospira pelophila TaxID=934 RepID=UPI0004A78533|nr:MFS transporter [Thiomicrospira pelophila]
MISAANLIRQPQFFALFVVQFLGAFNDNLFKNALVILITYRLLHDSNSALTITLAAGLFILPFFLFSPWGGQLADRWDKVWLMRKIKLAEILIMLLGSLAFFSGDIGFMLAVLFLLGVQSAFFGPIKYSILPEQVDAERLMQANAWFSGSTFAAILLGTLLGGFLILGDQGLLWVSAIMISFALIGYAASRQVDSAPHPEAVTLNQAWWSPYREVFKGFGDGRGFIVVSISFFWFIGASLLSQFPVWVKDYLYADEQVAVLFMALFALGFGLGAWLINWHLAGRTRLRYQPYLLALMALALADALWATSAVNVPEQLLNWREYLSQWPGNRVVFDLLWLAILGGAYCVPLYTQLQRQVPETQRARAFALNNVMNALFMVLSALAIMAGYMLGGDWLQLGAGLILIMLAFAFWEKRWRGRVNLLG